MSKRFSVRNGLKRFANIKNCEKTTRTRLWQVFADHEILIYKENVVRYDCIEKILAYFGHDYRVRYDPFDHYNNIFLLKKFVCEDCSWNEVYDFVEQYLERKKSDEIYDQLIDEFNNVLEDEQTGYRIVCGLVTPITNESEIAEIKDAINTCPEHVTKSIKKALELFAKRPVPDYNNAIKESISAVESFCCTIVADSGRTGVDTLSKAIDALERCGITLNSHLKSAIKELYKYTCSEDGTRHGGTTFIESSVEDARFMIITCSAIINYLMVKWDKVKGETTI